MHRMAHANNHAGTMSKIYYVDLQGLKQQLWEVVVHVTSIHDWQSKMRGVVTKAQVKHKWRDREGVYLLLPMPTACLAWSRRDSEFPEEFPDMASPTFWLPDFWLLGCMEAAALSDLPFMKSPACSRVDFWESGFIAAPALSVKDSRALSDMIDIGWLVVRDCF